MKLTPQQIQLIHALTAEGLSTAEVAKRVGCSGSTVRLHKDPEARARQREAVRRCDQKTKARNDAQRSAYTPPQFGPGARQGMTPQSLSAEVRERAAAAGYSWDDLPGVELTLNELACAGGPYEGHPLLHPSRIRRLAYNISKSWGRDLGELPKRPTPRKISRAVEPRILEIQTFRSWDPEGSLCPPSIAYRAQIQRVSASFPVVEMARGWLIACEAAIAKGLTPRHVQRGPQYWAQLSEIGTQNHADNL